MREKDLMTVASISALAFVAACVAHEAIGHGVMCLATGGHVALISSVYFRSTNTGPMTDAAGPMANLVLGGLLYLWVRRDRITSPHLRFFAVAAMALNLFWGSGYFIYSGVSNTGDWAFVVRGLALHPVWLWQVILILLGFFSYRLSIRVARSALSRYCDAAQDDRPSRPLFRPSVILYLSAGITCCVSVLPFRGALGPAFCSSLLEGFGAFIGLLYIAIQRSPAGAVVGDRGSGLPRSWRWIIGSLAGLILFIAVMGRGYFSGTKEGVEAPATSVIPEALPKAFAS